MSELHNFRTLIRQKFREDFSKNIFSLRKRIFEQNAYIEQNVNKVLVEQDAENVNQQLNKEEIQNSFENFFVSLANIIKSKTKIPQTTELKNSKNVTQQTITDLVNSAIDNKINANNFIDLIKKKTTTVFDSIRNESQQIFNDIQKKEQEQQQQQNQANQQQNQQQNQQNQQQNNNNQQKNTVESYKKFYKNGKILQERDDPITVNSLKNILKLTSQDKIADIISRFSKEDFEKFIDGLQKSSLDAISQALQKNTENSNTNQEQQSGEENQENQQQNQEQDKTTEEGGEGNLKLAEL